MSLKRILEVAAKDMKHSGKDINVAHLATDYAIRMEELLAKTDMLSKKVPAMAMGYVMEKLDKGFYYVKR